MEWQEKCILRAGEEWKFLESLPLLVDLAKWEATGHPQPHEVLVDLAPVVDKGHALPEFSEEKLSSSFPSSLEGGNIPLGDQAGRLSLAG